MLGAPVELAARLHARDAPRSAGEFLVIAAPPKAKPTVITMRLVRPTRNPASPVVRGRSPIEQMIDATATCGKCGGRYPCPGCWEDCACGGTKEVGYPCNGPTCDRNVPTMTAAQWVLLLDVEAMGAGGHRLADPLGPDAKVLRDKFHMIVARTSGLFICTYRGLECVAAVIRLDEETKANALREKRNTARRERRQKIREAQ